MVYKVETTNISGQSITKTFDKLSEARKEYRKGLWFDSRIAQRKLIKELKNRDEIIQCYGLNRR